MRDVTKLASPGSSVAAYRFASLLADRYDTEAAALLSTADTEEMCLVLARALAAAYWHSDPYDYRDKLRRMAADVLTARAKELT